MPADHFSASASPRSSAAGGVSHDLAPDLFETGTDRLPSSGQLSAASLTGIVLFAIELFAVPLVFAITLGASLLTWWILDQSWSGRRRHTRRRGITSRSLYLSTLMLVGMWLAVMFIFRASDPTLSTGFTTTLPMQMFGMDFSMLQSLNGMRTFRVSNAPMAAPVAGVAPFSLFAHGTASTIAIGLLAYAVASGRRRVRRRMREEARLAAIAGASARHSGAR